MIGSRQVDGFEALTLSSEEGEIEAAFVPEAGMVGCSLRHRGAELLGQRGGLARYVADRSTMGIPLLHPWANRVARRRFQVAGVEVDLDKASPPPNVDQHGLPIHGLLAAARGWRVERHESSGDGGVLAARFDFGSPPRSDCGLPVSPRAEHRGDPGGKCAHHRDHGRAIGRGRGADLVRLPPLLLPTRGRESRVGDRGAGHRAPRPRCGRAADGKAGARRGRGRAPGLAHLRR